MKWDLKINVTTILVLVAGISFFFWFSAKKNREIKLHLNTIAETEFAFDQYRSKVDSANISYQEAIDASNEALVAALKHDSIQAELVDHYKHLSEVVKIETVFKTDTVEVEVPIYIDHDTTVQISDPCFKADLSLFNGGLSLNGVTIDNRQDIVIGTQKRGLSRAQTVVSIRNTNSCIQVTGMQSYTVVYQKKWWENPLITIPASIAVGYAAGRLSK